MAALSATMIPLTNLVPSIVMINATKTILYATMIIKATSVPAAVPKFGALQFSVGPFHR